MGWRLVSQVRLSPGQEQWECPKPKGYGTRTSPQVSLQSLGSAIGAGATVGNDASSAENVYEITTCIAASKSVTSRVCMY